MEGKTNKKLNIFFIGVPGQHRHWFPGLWISNPRLPVRRPSLEPQKPHQQQTVHPSGVLSHSPRPYFQNMIRRQNCIFCLYGHALWPFQLGLPLVFALNLLSYLLFSTLIFTIGSSKLCLDCFH